MPRLFEAVEAAHAELEGTGYAVAQASLEQVFLRIARGEDADAAGGGRWSGEGASAGVPVPFDP